MQKRKLAAVMFTDIVGFSMKMGENEEATMRMLEQHDRIVGNLLKKYEGKLLKKLGDGWLIEFSSSVNAVKCSLKIQEKLQKYNQDKEGLERILLRIGIELGDIIIKEDDIFGEGVNIASRINNHSQPGGICVTENIYKKVKNKIELKAESLGSPKLKNIKDPIKLYHIKTGAEESWEGKKEESKEKEVLMNLKKSRKAYLLEYFCGFFILGLMGIIYLKGLKLNFMATYLVFGLGLFSLASAEVSRMMHRYQIRKDKLLIVEGLIKQHKKKVSFFSLSFVPDINLKQGRIQRLLNYGTVYVKQGENSFEIKDINNPHFVLEKVEELVEESRKQEQDRKI